jgi:hypothetical protein
MFDSRSDGFLLLRHDSFTDKWDLPSRGMIIGAKVCGRTLPHGGRRDGIGKWITEDDPRDWVGDLNCATFWRTNTREISGWAFAWPSAVTKTKSGGGGEAGGAGGGTGDTVTQNGNPGNIFGGGLFGNTNFLGREGNRPGGVFGGGLSGTGATIGLGGEFGRFETPPETPSPNDPTNWGGSVRNTEGGASGNTGVVGTAGPSGNTVARGGESGPTMVLPLNSMKLDDRFSSKVPQSYRAEDKRIWPLFPEKFMGITIADTKEETQQDVFCPTDPRLFAAHKYDSDMGTLVCGITDKGGIDADRAAKLQSAFKVIRKPDAGKLPYGQNPFIALNMAQSALLDSVGGAVVDGGDIGFFNQRYGGPFHPGGAGCQHQIDKSEDGTIYSCHLSTNALFIMPSSMNKDGPIEFETDEYPSDVGGGDKKMKVHCQWDPRSSHSHITGNKTGKWRFWAESKFSSSDQPCRPPAQPPGPGGRGQPDTSPTGIAGGGYGPLAPGAPFNPTDPQNVGDLGPNNLPGWNGIGPNPAVGSAPGGSTGQSVNQPGGWSTPQGTPDPGAWTREEWWLPGMPWGSTGIVGEPTAEQVAAAGLGPGSPGWPAGETYGPPSPYDLDDLIGPGSTGSMWDGPTEAGSGGAGSGARDTVATTGEIQSPGTSTTGTPISPGGQNTIPLPGGGPVVGRETGYTQQIPGGNTSASPPGTNPPGIPPVYINRPCAGVAGPGTANGGTASLPGNVVIYDLQHSIVSTDLDRPTFSTGLISAVAYKVACPGVSWACGLPDLTTGGVASGYSWRVRNGALVFSYHDSAAVKAEQIKFDNTGDLCFKSNTSYWANLHHINTADRTYTFPDLDTTAPRFVTMNKFTDGMAVHNEVVYGASDGAVKQNSNLMFDDSTLTLTGLFIANYDQIRVTTAKTIINSDDPGTTGDICWDADYIFVCVAPSSWKRAELLVPSGW